MNPIAEGLMGAVGAVWWAASFYVSHTWPVGVLLAVPALVRMAALVRGSHSPSGTATNTFELFPVLLRVTLFLVVASIDMSPAGSWWQNLWPGEWAPMLSARIASMSGRVDVWLWMGLGVALATLVIIGLVKLLASNWSSSSWERGPPRRRAGPTPSALVPTVWSPCR
jgi:hypothetical protein